MAYNYTMEKITDNHAKAVGVSLPISRKESVEICTAIRGMNVQKAIKYLEDVVALKKAVAYRRYNTDTGHKAGMMAGRYPQKSSSHILKVVQNAEANAQFKGLSTANLVIIHAVANKGPTVMHAGRTGGKAKRTHVEIILEERKAAEKKARKTAVKQEAKK